MRRFFFDSRFLRRFVFCYLAVLLAGATGLGAPPVRPRATASAGVDEAAGASGRQVGVTEGKKSKDEESYLRLRRDEQGRPVALEVAVVRFEPARRGKDSPVVDLVGAVHVAEPGYFAELNKRLSEYEAVLYELVAPEGTRPPRERGAGGGSPISAIQTRLTRLLDLQFQLEGIDYRRPNMVHADMSPAEFRESMRQHGESTWGMLFRMFAYSMARQAKDPSGTGDMELLMAFFDKNRALALKRAMAKQFEDLGGALLALDGPDGSTLISRRNAKALEVLRRELDSGKRKIAILYGAGHMPNMAKRLQAGFELRPTGKEWLRAWDMREPEAKQGEKRRGKPVGNGAGR